MRVAMVQVGGTYWVGGVGEGEVSRWFDEDERGAAGEASDIWWGSGLGECLRGPSGGDSKDEWDDWFIR